MKVFKFTIQALLISVFLAFFWFLFLVRDTFKTSGSIKEELFDSLLLESLLKGFSFALPSILIFGYYHFKQKKK